MLERIFIVLFVFYGFSINGQNSTYEIKNKEASTYNKADYVVGDILLVPFPDRLYKSHFNKELMEANDLNYDSLKYELRTRLHETIRNALNEEAAVVSLDASTTRSTHDRQVLFEAFSYDYKALPPVEDEEKQQPLKKLSRKFKKAPKEKQEGTRIEEGQLVTTYGSNQKYMSVSLTNPDVAQVLGKQYKNQFFLSLNQFEFVVPKDADPIQLQSGEYNRVLRIHYSFLNRKGQEVKGGIIEELVPSSVVGLSELTTVHFTSIGEKLLQALPVLKEEPEIER